MIIVNFAHPLTDDHLARIREITGEDIEEIINVDSQVDMQWDIVPQVEKMVKDAGLTSGEWRWEDILINPPALSYSTAALIAELYWRMRRFPPYIRMRPVTGPDGQRVTPPRFEVAEIVNL